MKSIGKTAPIAPYLGGKRNLSAKIIRKISKVEHDIYAEPFGGMGGIFLRRQLQPKLETINDINGEITNLFRILQRHYPQFMDTLRFQITSRQEFDRLLRSDASTLTDLERASRFLYLQRLAFGGKVRGRTFGVSMEGARFNLLKLASQLEDLHERMAGVVIENLHWSRFIERYDRPNTLFYIDPPYWGCEGDYGDDVFSQADFFSLAKILSNIQGSFILSINDVPAVRKLFAPFEIEEVSLQYSINARKPKAAKELIITRAHF